MDLPGSWMLVGMAVAANLSIVGASIAIRRRWGRSDTARAATFALGVQVARLMLAGVGLALAIWLAPTGSPAQRELLVLSWTGSYLLLVVADGFIEALAPRAPKEAHAA